MIVVRALSVTPVKGTRLHRVPEVQLGDSGARDDRRFFIVDGRDRMVNSKRLGALQTIVAELEDGRLRLELPGGEVVDAAPSLGPRVTTRFYSDRLDAHVVQGPWSEALSKYLGETVRLVEPASGAVDRGSAGGATLVSQASLRALAEAAGEADVDSRRFRMLIEIDGVAAHEEDRWVGSSLRIGTATIHCEGHVGRCLITSRHPETGAVDLPTLDIIREYRQGLEATAPLPFGIYGRVTAGGTIRVGDSVAIVE